MHTQSVTYIISVYCRYFRESTRQSQAEQLATKRLKRVK